MIRLPRTGVAKSLRRSITTLARPFALDRDEFLAFKKNFDSASPVPQLFSSKFEFPETKNWFKRVGEKTMMNEAYFAERGTDVVEAEVTQSTQSGEISKFDRISLPLASFIRILNLPQPELKAKDPIPSLYLAQSTPPVFLSKDTPVPNYIKKVGKNDSYGAALWLGTTPTLTPLHRDPNPNLLVQLSGKKILRLVEPKIGNGLMELARGAGKLQDESIMSGQIREKLDLLIWGNPFGANGLARVVEEQKDYDRWEAMKDSMYEATIGEGDAIFIPTGWYHSVKGIGSSETAREINCSVNWWFR